jgi:hypothetical protein
MPALTDQLIQARPTGRVPVEAEPWTLRDFLKALVITTAVGLAAAYLLTSSTIVRLGYEAVQRAFRQTVESSLPHTIVPKEPEESTAPSSETAIIVARRSD